MGRRSLRELFAQAALADRDIQRARFGAQRDSALVGGAVGALANAGTQVLGFADQQMKRADADEGAEADAFAETHASDKVEGDEDPSVSAAKIMGRWKPPAEGPKEGTIEHFADRVTGGPGRRERAGKLATGKLATGMQARSDKDAATAAVSKASEQKLAAGDQEMKIEGDKAALEEARLALLPSVQADRAAAKAKKAEGFAEEDMPTIGESTSLALDQLVAKHPAVDRRTFEGLAVKLNSEAFGGETKLANDDRGLDIKETTANRPRGRAADPAKAADAAKKRSLDLQMMQARLDKALGLTINNAKVPADVRKDFVGAARGLGDLAQLRADFAKLQERYGGDVVGAINNNVNRIERATGYDDPDVTKFVSRSAKVKAAWGKATFGAAISAYDASQIADAMPDMTPGMRLSDDDVAFGAKLDGAYEDAVRGLEASYRTNGLLVEGGLPEGLAPEAMRKAADDAAGVPEPLPPMPPEGSPERERLNAFIVNLQQQGVPADQIKQQVIDLLRSGGAKP